MLHSFSRNHHHHHHYFKYNRIKGKEDLDGRTQIQIYTNKIHVNTLRIFEVVHLWIILNRFIIGVIHIHAVISDHVESSNEQFHTGRIVGVLKSIERSPLREIRL